MTVYDTSDWFLWDPSPDLFTIPYFELAIRWYGAFFALGFIVGYFVILKIYGRYLSSRDKAIDVADHLLWYVVLGAIFGARLGHVFFYSWPQFQNDPISILKVWEGGLASHGGAVGIFLGLLLFRWRNKAAFPSMTILALVDGIVIPTAFAGGCIRLGNFFNQEIVGRVTEVPWAIVFGHPYDGSLPLPRHPVQLYEALFYFSTFLLFSFLWNQKKWKIGTGAFSGLFFTIVFGFRFFVEFLKNPQSALLAGDSTLLMGQYLSIPCVLLGLVLLYRARRAEC